VSEGDERSEKGDEGERDGEAEGCELFHRDYVAGITLQGRGLETRANCVRNADSE
jgi:hypothetical protein